MPAVAAALVTTAGTLYANSQANNAAEDAAQAQLQGQQQALDLQRQQYQQTRQDLAPYMGAGTASLQNLDAFLAQTIPGYRSMYGQQAGPDWNAYLQANPDAAAWVQAKALEPDGQGKSLAELAQWHHQLDGSRREVPQTQAAPAQAAPTMTRPETGPAPSPWDFGVAMGPPDSASYLTNYQESPAYKARTKTVTRDVNSGYAAKGLLRSGGAIKALSGKINDLADEDYDNWVKQRLSALQVDLSGYNARQRNYEVALGQYNANRNVLNSNFETDRSFGTGNLFDLVRLGQNSAVGAGNFGQSFANQGSNLFQDMGQTRANQYAQTGYNNALAANNITGAFGNIFNNWPRSSNPLGTASSGWNIPNTYDFGPG